MCAMYVVAIGKDGWFTINMAWDTQNTEVKRINERANEMERHWFESCINVVIIPAQISLLTTNNHHQTRAQLTQTTNFFTFLHILMLFFHFNSIHCLYNDYIPFSGRPPSQQVTIIHAFVLLIHTHFRKTPIPNNKFAVYNSWIRTCTS